MAGKKGGGGGPDITTILGLILAFGVVLLANYVEGGSPSALANKPAAILVFGGSIALAMFCNPLKDFLAIPKLLGVAFFGTTPDIKSTINTLMQLAQDARREGLLKLEEAIPTAKSEFIRKGLQLVVDGQGPETVQEMLEIEMAQAHERHRASYGIFEALGGFGPTLGIIGTVMGLVNVLNHLADSDPSELGHSIATAFIATLYGVGTANLLWLPLAAKLKAKDRYEALENELIIEGLLSIMKGENPAIVKEKLTAYVQVKLRSEKEGKGKGKKAEG